MAMNVLVIGSGGREHALTWKLAQSPRISRLVCAPGNGGMAGEVLVSNGRPVEIAPIPATDLQALVDFAKREAMDFTVVGPDDPLALGIVDLFQENGLRAWGPNRSAARFEASKAFSQDFMERYGIPTAKSGTFEDAAEAREFARSLGGRCAVKADGLALGKGVLICFSPEESDAAVDQIMVDAAFGNAGQKVVIQEFLEGREMSLHALVDGSHYLLFPTSQDHKRALDADQGLNTGGMGTYSPAPFLSDAEVEEVGRAIMLPWLEGCRQEGIDFRGMLYPGVMLTAEGPKVLEFNARFGDPETQVYLPRLENDLLDLLEACVDGTLDQVEVHWKSEAAVCVVMASGGYPESYAKGKVIEGIPSADALENVKVFHAGTQLSEGRLVTSGGRVLGVTALGADIRTARDKAYEALEMIHFEAAHWRRDIAGQALQHSS